MSQPNTLTINDLANIVNFIDIVTTRGALKGPELTSVGAIRDKLVSHIEAHEEAVKKAEEAKPKQALETVQEVEEEEKKE